MPWLALGIGAAAGLLKSELVDKPREDRQRKLASATQRFSPWTHLQAQPVQEADPFGSALQFGATGAMMGQNIQNAGAQGQLANDYHDFYQKNGYMPGQTNMNFGTTAPPPTASPWGY